MTNGAPKLELLPPLPPEDASPLASYGEEDDAATQLVDISEGDPKWLVRVTPFDRRLMETSDLIRELSNGTLGRDTLVWQSGMPDWLPIEKAAGLPSVGLTLTGPAHDKRQSSPQSFIRLRRPTPDRAVIAAGALAIATVAVTLAILAAGGVFETAGFVSEEEMDLGQGH